MNTLFSFQPFRPGQETEISGLIRRVYDEFVAPDYTEEGNRFFYDWIHPDRILERQSQLLTLWIALENDRIVGMIEMRRHDHISLLFVEKARMGQGIARELYRLALEQSLGRNPLMKEVFVHASPYSVPAYEKLGFRKAGEMKTEHGIRYLPMKMVFNSQQA